MILIKLLNIRLFKQIFLKLFKLATTIINDAVMSSDARFIVAGTNNNLVIIYKLSIN